MKRNYLILCLAFFITLFTGCGIKAADSGTAAEAPKVPEPDSMNYVSWDCGTYYSNISADNIKAFLQKLKEDGWTDFNGDEFSDGLTDGISEYMLIRGDDLLQFMINLTDRTEAICNSILVREDSNLPIGEIKSRMDTVSKADAKECIQQYVNRVQNSEEFPFAAENLIGVFEIFPEGAFEKMDLQAFAAISDSGFYGCFLIRKGVISYVGGNLDNACIADIDADGKYELVDLYTAWEGNIIKINLMAYTYINPISFNSNTEILQVEYSNCFVPKQGYEELFLKKAGDNDIKLTGNGVDYGDLRIDGTSLVVDRMEEFPFDEWAKYYSQDILKEFDKAVPASPPDIGITVDGTTVGYTVRETDWDKKVQEYTIADAFKEITAKEQSIPTFNLSNRIEFDLSKPVIFDFGNSIPDSITIYDAMLDTDGSVRYGERLIQNQIFKIIDKSHVQFDLKQHMSYFLSSNTGDYERDWYRLFRVVCKWGENECTYAFLINTGSEEKFTEPTELP